MKLRNKKTGEAVYVDFQIPLCNNDEILGSYCVTSLEELNRSFEDYKPKEPLIKDEKIRKAVRAWAEANNIRAVYYSPEEDGFYVKNFDGEIVASIYFGDKPMEEDGYGEHYTIAELCGEEEE